MKRVVECVPNFSEGRDASVVQSIIDSIAGAEVRVLASESDPDHNRSVITFAGEPSHVVEAAFRAVAKAAETIDLTRQSGVHPRIGAADVVPIVPLRNITLEECAALAHALGERIWRDLHIPVYFYEAAALRPERKRLEVVRRGGFEALRVTNAPDRQPDVGGPGLHPTAGAVAIGARKILLAFNINLATTDITIAQQIAVKIRASSGGLPHVKAMGVPLESRGLAQVSMNLTDFEVTPLRTVFDAVRAEAHLRGVEIAGSEIIGLMPERALDEALAKYLLCENFSQDSILERRLETLLID
ncbi:MAG: glutamate formimidoyltransferase [Candidatus Solibacter usitatus]|nr:glutamate formimidoyltransferase [Candidatus Solibacter usitatus]